MQCGLTWSSKRKIVLSQERDPSRLLKDLKIVVIDPIDWRVAYCCCQIDRRGSLGVKRTRQQRAGVLVDATAEQ